jgi:ABC-type multidrug transport system ATPase subunit
MKPVKGKVDIAGLNPFMLVPKKRIHLAYYINQINALQFTKNTLEKEIFAAEKLSEKKEDRASYEHFFLPEDRDYNPFELSVNEARRFALYLGMIIDPQILFIDEIPSAVNAMNHQVLEHILCVRKAKGQITILSYQRPIDLEFDSVITIASK